MSQKSNKTNVSLLAVAAIVLLGGSCLWCATRPSPVKPAPVPATTADTPQPAPDRRPVVASPQPQTEPKRQAAPVPARAADAGTPQCTRTLDCKGPKQADCVRPACINGKCVYDYSFCECRTNDDCDDGDPCTRNHCFSSTMKCIFIKDGCRD